MDQVDPEALARLRAGIQHRVVALRKSLDAWIEEHNGPLRSCERSSNDPGAVEFRGPYSEITTALLSTAIDRMIALHGDGGPDALTNVQKIFDARLRVYKQRLQ